MREARPLTRTSSLGWGLLLRIKFRALALIQGQLCRNSPSFGRVGNELASFRGGVHWRLESTPPASIPSPKPRASASTLPREGEIEHAQQLVNWTLPNWTAPLWNGFVANRRLVVATVARRWMRHISHALASVDTRKVAMSSRKAVLQHYDVPSTARIALL